MRSAMRMFRAGLLLVALLSVAVGVGGCSLLSGNSSGSDNPFGAAGSGSVGAVVENQHWSDMVVYVVASGTRRRLGMVTTANRTSFELDRNLLTSNLYLRAEAVGSTRFVRTDVLNVSEGDVVVWTIRNQLDLSDYVIR